jgi:hypothetical protein
MLSGGGSGVICIGIRAAPKSVTFAIYDADAKAIITVEQIKIPASFSTPNKLKYVRSNLLDILREFNVTKAGVRVSEPFAKSLNIDRVQIEGVVQEAFASSELKAYYIGQISSISARLGIERNAFKPLVEGSENYDIENWQDLDREEREAILCAIGAVDV